MSTIRSAAELTSHDACLHDVSHQITLQVGEQRFQTSKTTLDGSPVFKNFLAERWNDDPYANNIFYLDADPEAFKHIIRFLRHGIYPLCYSEASGHNYALYATIYNQAESFRITKLSTWLHDKKYLQAIKISTSTRVVEGTDSISASTPSNVKTKYYPQWRIVKKYVCPRGIPVHYDNPSACGRACLNAQGDADDEFDEIPVLSTVVVMEKVEFEQKLCLAGE